MFLPRAFTLHIRLTRDCNAHCNYCSSAGKSEGRMSTADFKKSVQWISEELFPKLRVGSKHHLTVEYLGGEVLLIPQNELEENVSFARETFGPLVHTLRDGAQSNLIGSKRRTEHLFELFQGHVGTSWDPITQQRHIHGNHQLYKAMLDATLDRYDKQHDFRPGRVVVVDEQTAPHMAQMTTDAIEQGYDLVFRPVFQGGSEDVSKASLNNLITYYAQAYQAWVSHGAKHHIEPFHSLFNKRLNERKKDFGPLAVGLFQQCPFQSDCAFKSLSLDPDGELYVCQEMADAKNYSLGNAITQEFNTHLWERLAQRKLKLDKSCVGCTWKRSCNGGCMNEAIEHHGDPFAKTELCSLWTSLFIKIDEDINHLLERQKTQEEYQDETL